MVHSQHRLNIDPGQACFASLDVACSVFDQATRDNKQVLLFVHGYNNDMADIVKAATETASTRFIERQLAHLGRRPTGLPIVHLLDRDCPAKSSQVSVFLPAAVQVLYFQWRSMRCS